MNNILILLNDTDPVLARVCRNKFKKQGGWDSLITTTYQEAVDAFREKKLDIVMTDIILSTPEKSGFDFIQEVRGMAGSPNAKVPIIVFSRLGQAQDIEKAISLGATKYFDKNKMTIHEVIEELKKYLNK